MARLFGNKHGAVVLPPWFRIVRALQIFFALLVIGLVSYALSVRNGSGIRPALILTLITAILTIVLIVPLTFPLPGARALVHPLGALAADLVGMMLWLASLTALASYERVYSYYRHGGYGVFGGPTSEAKVARAWKCGVAATVFAALEFLLFLATTKLFAYFYHHHLAGTQPSGTLFRPTTFGGGSSTAAGNEGVGMTDTEAAPPAGPSSPPYTNTTDDAAPSHRPHEALSPLSQPFHSAPIPTIETTSATPTTATAAPQNFDEPPAPGPYEPGHGTARASPIIPDVRAKAHEARRPPYPELEDAGARRQGRV